MLERLFRQIFRLYRRRLEKQIDLERWDSELSGKIDAIIILIDE